ncbi:MAG: hypothetical protein M3Y76_01320 [Chloroflexota bacterium]|nr:hypothetical protein [Chloroflexota bacterium]
MYRRNPVRAMAGGISGGIFLIGLAIAFFVGPFLPILFVTLAITTLLGSLSSLRPNGFYGGIQSFVWMLGLAFCFAVGFWPWILVVCGVSAILGALRVPIMAAILGMGIFGIASLSNQPPQSIYQPYQQGYAPSQQQENYQEGGQQHPYPSQSPQQYQQPPQPQYEQPQAQYPQEMPPQQMQ